MQSLALKSPHVFLKKTKCIQFNCKVPTVLTDSRLFKNLNSVSSEPGEKVNCKPLKNNDVQIFILFQQKVMQSKSTPKARNWNTERFVPRQGQNPGRPAMLKLLVKHPGHMGLYVSTNEFRKTTVWPDVFSTQILPLNGLLCSRWLPLVNVPHSWQL